MATRCAIHPEVESKHHCRECGAAACPDCMPRPDDGCARCQCSAKAVATAQRRVRALGVCMIAHGGALAVLGALFAFVADSAGVLADVDLGTYAAVIAPIHIGAGVLQILSGVLVRESQARVFAFIALLAGLPTTIGLAAAVTSWMLATYGVGLLRRPAIRQTFG